MKTVYLIAFLVLSFAATHADEARVTADGNWIEFKGSIYRSPSVSEKAHLTFADAKHTNLATPTDGGKKISYDGKVYEKVQPSTPLPAKKGGICACIFLFAGIVATVILIVVASSLFRSANRRKRQSF